MAMRVAVGVPAVEAAAAHLAAHQLLVDLEQLVEIMAAAVTALSEKHQPVWEGAAAALVLLAVVVVLRQSMLVLAALAHPT